MVHYRKRIELFFEHSSRLIYRNAIMTLSIMALFMGSTGFFIKDLTVDTATESMLHKNDPSLLAYNTFRDQFGHSEFVSVLVEAPDIFSRESLLRLKALHDDLEKNLPFLKKVTSLINVRTTYGRNDVLHVHELLEDPSKDNPETVRERALSSPFYKNHILSADQKSTALIIETVSRVFEHPDTDQDKFSDFVDFEQSEYTLSSSGGKFHYITTEESARVNTTVLDVLKRHQLKDFKLTFSGGTVVLDLFNKATSRDTSRLFVIMFFVILAFLFLMFRRVSGMVLPLIVVSGTTVTVLGLMGFTGTPISLMTNVLPAFLVSVCIADSVHVLAIFYRKFQAGESRENAICHAMYHLFH